MKFCVVCICITAVIIAGICAYMKYLEMQDDIATSRYMELFRMCNQNAIDIKALRELYAPTFH